MDRQKQLSGRLITVLASLLLIYHYAVNYGANSNAQRNLLSKNWDSDYQKEEGIKGVYEYFRSIGKLPVDKQTTNKADAAANDPTTEWFKSQAANPSAVLITILIPKSTENETILCSDALEEDALKEIGRIAVNDKEFECDPVRIAQMLGEEWEYFGCDDDKQEWVAEGSKMHKFGRKKGMDDMKSAYKRWCDKQLCDEDVFMFKVNRQEKWFKSYTKCGELHGLGSNGLDEAQMDSLIHEMGTNGWEEKGKKNPSEYYQISKKMRSKRMLKPFKCKCAKCNRAKAVGEEMRQSIQESDNKFVKQYSELMRQVYNANNKITVNFNGDAATIATHKSTGEGSGGRIVSQNEGRAIVRMLFAARLNNEAKSRWTEQSEPMNQDPTQNGQYANSYVFGGN